jgi:hypothetical protein
VRYQFVACGTDEDGDYFLFDMHCDGKDLQKARWVRETEETEEDKPEAPARAPQGISVMTADERARLEAAAAKPKETAPPPRNTDVAPVQPLPTQPTQPAATTDFSGRLFDDDGGTMNATRDGADYLKNNWESIIKDARTDDGWRDSSGRTGIRIVGVRNIAGRFGIQKDDVILRVNDQPVSSREQAINVVKKELQKPNNHVIRVTVLRLGAEKTLRFDARDPDTRRMARDAMK